MTIHKNQTLTITPQYINERGEAVSEKDGVSIVCAGLLPGEESEVRIIKPGKNTAFARISRIIRPDKDRTVPDCRNRNCRTCDLIFASYERQLKIKKDIISRIFGYGIDIEGSVQYGYRNKSVLPVSKKGDKISIGTYRQNSHDINDWTYPCPVLTDKMNGIIKQVKTLLADLPDKHIPSQLFIRGAGNFYQVGFIINEPSGQINRILKMLASNITEIRSVFYSVASGTNSVLIRDPVFVEGEDHCLFKTGSKEYKVSPSSFFQANLHTTDHILNKIGTVLRSSPGLKVLDLYSGCGVLSDFPEVSRTCVESNTSSFGFLEENENSRLISAETSTVISEIANGKYDIIIADPPRKGIDKHTLKAVDSSSAHTFIYLSCEPKTQKRDIGILNNYEITEITAYDMFPNTVHIESLAILKRKEL